MEAYNELEQTENELSRMFDLRWVIQIMGYSIAIME